VADRCAVVGGDFFASVPPGGDAYVLAQIVHDWPDAEALAILSACQRAMAPGARLWVIEQVLPPEDDPDPFERVGLTLLEYRPNTNDTPQGGAPHQKVCRSGQGKEARYGRASRRRWETVRRSPP
jgi:hypothetical protein